MITVMQAFAYSIVLLCSLCSVSGMAAATAELDLGARVQPLPIANRFTEPGYHVWCGSPLRTADGRYYLFYSRWPEAATFHPGWAIRSEIAYAIADRAEGPYHPVNVALPARGAVFWDGSSTHNPTVIQVGTRFALFYTGNTGNGSYWIHRNNQRIGVALADKPEGPWTRFDHPIIEVSNDPTAFDALCVANPAACLRPDGSILLHYKGVAKDPTKEPKGGVVRYGAALAERPEGPYTKVPSRIFLPPEGAKANHWMAAEDSFIWYSELYGKQYYAVVRDVSGLFTGESGGIALFQSVDGLDWKLAAQPKVLGKNYLLADGKRSAARLERPMVLIENGEPMYLFGAADGFAKEGKTSANVQIPLR